ncbi:hypothetical protein PF005_g19914 [Phytophthora fragariae]|uniref:Uncharacterized protein n=1 Tax=Phytophthora fragariae TaxID=53985 RepID=A0A6A3XHW0_9STRA|nr:hypothetical protein PF003_g20840 [Phytophthora fragariae]KAE8929050.1 hypothetical protein PF009_g20825 [Phytophthora fragariae]KAE8989581.1 hypothetical protein PF011_g18708 [Phytophthora fragariae]KAE9088230.1 hypothetical protein PF007_g20057 [Phytophthora fragariae]KAE9088369.1 hypothetical protein PF010_g19406 [Phytophthora fragariae]
MEFMQMMKDSMAKMKEEIAQFRKQGARVEREHVSPVTLPNLTHFAPMSPEVVEAL